MIKKIFLFFIFCVCFNSKILSGEEQVVHENGSKLPKNDTIKINDLVIEEEKLPLKLYNLIDLALERNEETKQAYINVKLVEFNLTNVRSVYYPSISANINYNEDDGDRYKIIGKNKTLSENISLNYKLFAFGKYRANVKSVEHYLDSIKYKENQTVQNIIYNVIENYYALLSLKAQKETATETENLNAQIFNVANLKYKLGLVPLVDKLKSNTAYSQSKLNTINIESEIKKQKANLNVLLNLEPDYVLYLEIPEINVKKIKNDVHYFMNEAKSNRLELKILQSQLKQKNKELQVAEMEFLPEISVYGKLSNNKNISDNRHSKSYFDNSIGVNVNIPLFNGFSNVTNVKIKKKEINYLESQINQLEKKILNEVWEVYNDFDVSQTSYFIAKDLLKSAMENFKVNLGMYKNGKASILEVLDSQNQLEKAKFEFVNSKYNWLIYRMKLLRVVGKMNLDNIINIDKL